MIIDIHTHTFPARIAEKALRGMQAASRTALFSDGTEEGLLRTEKEAGVDLAVVQPVATYPAQVTSINSHVLERFPREVPAGVLSFGAMHPGCEAWEEELEKLRAAGIPGIKLHAAYENIPMDDPRTVRILKKCRDLDLIVLIHSGWDVGLPREASALPEKTRRALDQTGPMKLIAAHMGGWRCWQEAAELLSDTGICIDTAFSLGAMSLAPGAPWEEAELRMLTEAEALDLIRAWGVDRVLFGTDSPWGDPAEELEKIRSLPLSDKEKEAICGGNALRLLPSV